MIERLLESVRRRVDAADAVTKADDTLTVTLDDEGRVSASARQGEVGHLRVRRRDRVASTYSTGVAVEELAERALAELPDGEEVPLYLPAPSPLPGVMTCSPQAATAGTNALLTLLRPLSGRLKRTDRRVEVWAERSAGSVRVANTRGVLAEYETAMVGVGAVVESIGAGAPPPCRVHLAAGTMPSFSDVGALVEEVDRRLAPPPIDPGSLPTRMTVCMAPRALATLLLPLRAALLGHEALLGRSPVRGRLGERLYDERFSLTDDALLPARPGSRPLDDDGVPSRRVTLVEGGKPVAAAADLRVGALANVPSTGHGWRRPFTPPRAGFTNLLVHAGETSRAALLGLLAPGLLVEDLEWGAGPNPLPGALIARAPWVYLVEQGEVRGRLESVTLAGNVYELLGRIVAIGSDATWIGSFCGPSVVFEGIGVSRS